MKRFFARGAYLFFVFIWIQACESRGNDSPPPQSSSPVSPSGKENEPGAPVQNLESEKPEVNQSLDKILDLFAHGKNDIAAKSIVYTGPDLSRNWKSVYDYSEKEEKSRVDIMAAKVRMLTEDADEVTKGKFRTETESEGTWYMQELIFTFPDGKKESKYFGFLKVNSNYCLGDIE